METLVHTISSKYYMACYCKTKTLQYQVMVIVPFHDYFIQMK